MKLNPKFINFVVIAILAVFLFSVATGVIILQRRVTNLESRPAVTEIKTVVVTPTETLTPTPKLLKKITVPQASISAH